MIALKVDSQRNILAVMDPANPASFSESQLVWYAVSRRAVAAAAAQSGKQDKVQRVVVVGVFFVVDNNVVRGNSGR